MVQCLRFRVPLRGGSIPGQGTKISHATKRGQKERRKKKECPESDQAFRSWFKIEKGVCQGCIQSPCLFNLNAAYITRNVGLDESPAGIKTAGEKYQ